jgi:tetratricopeptide (TPR) repeat protein
LAHANPFAGTTLNTCSGFDYNLCVDPTCPCYAHAIFEKSFVVPLHAKAFRKEKTMKKELTELLEKGYQAEKEFIAALSDEERNAEGSFERWTAKDTLAHNSYWRKSHAEDVLAVLAGESPVHTDDDEINEGVYSQNKDQSWDAIEALAKTSLERMGAALAALSEADLQRSDFYPWEQGRPLWREVVGNLYTHPILHLSDWYIKRGNPARAAEMYQEMTDQLTNLDNSPEWQGTIRYNLACSYSLLGQKEKAIRTLDEALRMNPTLVEWSKQDPDFEPIREEAGYKALYN